MTPERAAYILGTHSFGQLRFAFHRDSMTDAIHDDGITTDEHFAIKAIWRRLPGWCCYADAVAAIAYPEKWKLEAEGRA